MKRPAGLVLAGVISAITMISGLRFEAPAVDIADTLEGYSLSFPEGGKIFLSNLQIRARQIELTAQGKKVGEARLRQARFEGNVAVIFPESNLIKAERGLYEKPIFRLEGRVECAIGEWKCEATRVLFLTDTNILQLEDGRLLGQTLQLSGRHLIFSLTGPVLAEGKVSFSAAGLEGQCEELAYDPDTKQVSLKEATIALRAPAISVKGTEIRLQDNLQTVIVKGEINATLGGPDGR